MDRTDSFEYAIFFFKYGSVFPKSSRYAFTLFEDDLWPRFEIECLNKETINSIHFANSENSNIYSVTLEVGDETLLISRQSIDKFCRWNSYKVLGSFDIK